MSILHTRRDNLKKIIDELYYGKQVKLAAALGINLNYISRLLNPKSEKKIGDKFCRKIEEISSKPVNWMDNPHKPLSQIAKNTHDIDLKILSVNIFRLMNENPMLSSETKLAHAASVSQSTVHRILNMESSASISNISSIARAFGVSPFELIMDSKDPRALIIDLKKYSMLSDYHKETIRNFIEFTFSQAGVNSEINETINKKHK